MVERIPALILAGGRATRMGGGDKCHCRIGDRRLLDLVIERLGTQCAPLALNANGDPLRFADTGLPVLPDTMPGHPGPLAGILAGLDWAAGMGCHRIISVAADTPFFPRDLALRLSAAAGPSGLALAATADATGKLWRHPTFGIWPVALRCDLRRALDDGLRKIVLWTERHGAGTAMFDSAAYDPFFNVNAPEDIETAAGLMARIAP